MEATGEASEGRAQEPHAQDKVPDATRTIGSGGDPSRICQRCKLPLRNDEKITRILGQVIHTHTRQCVVRLRQALDDCYGSQES